MIFRILQIFQRHLEVKNAGFKILFEYLFINIFCLRSASKERPTAVAPLACPLASAVRTPAQSALSFHLSLFPCQVCALEARTQQAPLFLQMKLNYEKLLMA